MDQSLLKAFGVDKLRFQDLFVFVAFATAVMVFRAPDSFVLQPSWRFEVKPATDNEKGFLPLPIITDLDGDGINDIEQCHTEVLIATREPGIKILMLPSLGPHKKLSVLPHLHTKAEMLLPSKNQTPAEDNKQSNPMPVAMATGCLHKSGSDLKSCRQVIVVMTDDSVVSCYDHLLKLLWKAPLSNNRALEKHFYKEVSIYVDHDSIKGGLIVIGLRIGEESSLTKEHSIAQCAGFAVSFVKLPTMQGKVEREDHFSTYALSGLTGRLIWKHEPGDFEKNETTTSEEDILSSYHYKLSLSFSQYHVGEVHWSHFSKALIDNLPHRNNHPSHLEIKVMNFVKDSQRIKGVKRPNAVVIHNQNGVEVLEITTGRPICHFPSPKTTVTLADVNQDGAIDQVESVFWAHPTHQNDDRIPHCSGVVRTGSKILFVGNKIKNTILFQGFKV